MHAVIRQPVRDGFLAAGKAAVMESLSPPATAENAAPSITAALYFMLFFLRGVGAREFLQSESENDAVVAGFFLFIFFFSTH